MGEPDSTIVAAVMGEAKRLVGERMTVLGICGAQGSGKSTLARVVMDRCARQGIAAATLSLDDLYLPRAARQRLARDVHPLFATRGVPGTHDVALGLDVLAALARGKAAALPRFSKAADDRLPRSDWRRAPPDCRLLLFEGWCVGARPQAQEALQSPANALEAQEDADGIWRRHVNAALAGDYRRLFAPIDSLVLLAAPAFDVVFEWREQQEEELRAAAGASAPGLMDGPQLARFIQHYERLTRHILAEMPRRADVVINLARDRTALSIMAASAPF